MNSTAKTSKPCRLNSGFRVSNAFGGAGSVKIELNRDWSEFLRALISQNVRFLLIGGRGARGAEADGRSRRVRSADAGQRKKTA